MNEFLYAPRFCFAEPLHNLGHALRRAAVLAATPALRQSRDWKICSVAKGIEHDLELAHEAGEDGGIYRQNAMRRAIGLSARIGSILT